MSGVSTAFDAFTTRLGTLFTTGSGYRQLTNPYDLEDNNVQFLRKGWGLAVGAASNTNRELCGKITVRRIFRVVLSRSLDSLEHDIASKDTVVKLMLEDAKTVITDFERRFRLSDDFYNTAYETDSGIQSLRGDDFSILTLELTFNVEFFDSI